MTPVQGDVSDVADLDRLYTSVKEQKGHLDAVFTNAVTGTFMPIERVTEEAFYGCFDANVKSLLFTIQKALPLLMLGASIILNASINTVKVMLGLTLYSGSKAAVRSFARTLRLLFSRHNSATMRW